MWKSLLKKTRDQRNSRHPAAFGVGNEKACPKLFLFVVVLDFVSTFSKLPGIFIKNTVLVFTTIDRTQEPEILVARFNPVNDQ